MQADTHARSIIGASSCEYPLLSAHNVVVAAPGMIITPFKPAPGSVTDFGAEITGLDLAAPMSDETFKELETAVYTHGVVIVRGQVR